MTDRFLVDTKGKNKLKQMMKQYPPVQLVILTLLISVIVISWDANSQQ